MTVTTVREPLYRVLPDCRQSFGDLAAQVGVGLGLPPDDEQRAALDGIFAERAPGEPASRHAAVIGARQNIKTSTLEIASATDLLVFGIPGAVWTAHESKTATKAFQDLLPRLLGNPDFSPLIGYKSGRGEELIYLLDDPPVSLEYRARSGGSGRGFTTARLTLDEALYLRAGDMGALLPTMLTRRDAQVRYGSSGGFAWSEVLRSLRQRAKDRSDPRLFYVEYGSERRNCEDDSCSHAWGVEGCALDDRELWWQANCALWSGRIDEENILDLRRSMPPGEFAREVLVWWDDPSTALSVIPIDRYNALRADAPEGDPQAFGLDVTWDREWATLGWGLGDYVEVHKHARGAGWVVEECVRLQKDYPDAAVWTEAKGPASTLIEPLREAGVRVEEVPSEDYRLACGGFYDAVTEGTLRHSGDPSLDAAVAGAQVTGGASGFVWDKKRGAVISPLVAVTHARWGAKNGTSRYETRGLVTL